MAMDANEYTYAILHINSARRRFDRIYETLEEGEETSNFGDEMRQNMLEDGEESIDDSQEQMIDSLLYTTYQDMALVDCQICIEIATKALFPLMGIRYPQNHAISFNDAEDLIRKIKYEDDFGWKYTTGVPRAIFLTQLWSIFYTLAKYGEQSHQLTTNQIFQSEDAEYALQHAEFCVELAEDLSDLQEDRYEEEHGETPENAWLRSQ